MPLKPHEWYFKLQKWAQSLSDSELKGLGPVRFEGGRAIYTDLYTIFCIPASTLEARTRFYLLASMLLVL